MNKLKIRFAEKKDTPVILEFINALAEYEHMSDAVKITEDIIKEFIFDKHTAKVIFASLDGKDVGFALFYYNFSTFTGKMGLYIEDLFVYPQYRGKGLGKALFQKLSEIAAMQNCGRIEWVCLNWNKSGSGFYKKMNASAVTDRTIYRLDLS